MAIPVWLKGGRGGSQKQAVVTDDGAVATQQIPYPELYPTKVKPFRQYFTIDGTSAGSTDMGIDGSVTNVDFWVPAHKTSDRYITNINVIVGYAASGAPFKWADGTALTNGTRLFYESATQGEVDIHDGIKSNQDLFRLNNNGIGTAWEVRHVNANNDYGYFVPISLIDYVPPLGIKLDAGSSQRMAFCVRDNAGTSALSFNAIAYGFDRFK